AARPPLPPLRPAQVRWVSQEHAQDAAAGMPDEFRRMFDYLRQFNADAQRHAGSIFTRAIPPEPTAAGSASIDKLFAAADWLAVHFQRQVLRAMGGLSVLAALMGIAFIGYSHLPENLPYRDNAIYVFVILFAAGVLLARVAQRRGWHRRYIDYRALAEGLRVQRYWLRAGVDAATSGAFAHDNFLQKQDVELGWIRNVMRTAGLYAIGAPERSNDLSKVVAEWIGEPGGDGQLGYFSRKAEQCSRAHHRMQRLTHLLLFVVIALSIFLAAFHRRLSADATAGLVAVMGALAIVAAARESYAHRKADKELIKQYRYMRGIFANAHRKLDAEPDPALLHVPAGFAPGGQKRYPLVVLLHGLNGTPERIMEAFLDTKSRAPSVGGFVLAPHAHGNAFYRGPGEREVMAAVDWALATYPIDPLRVSVSGVSMGGTGAAHLGLYYAERFSAAAPLCGYHSYFVRRDTKNRPIRPWETERMHHWSPASLAERGRNLPLWVAHGTKDFPLENSRVLVDRYKQLGYSITDEWPDTGHDVWTKAYAGARLYPWLSKAVLDPAAARVTVKSDSLRFGRLHWAAIRELEVPGKAGTLDVDASSTPVRVKTDAVSGFELARGPRLPKTGPVELEIDGQSLGFAAEEAVSAQKRDGRWTKGAPSARGKRPGLEGPIRDAYLEPLVFSYGTGDPRTTRANREVALGLSRRFGPEVGYRVLSDAELDAATLAGHSVLAVGSPRDHLLLGRVAKDLLIQSERGALVAGARRFERAGTGAIFIQPNPAAKERYLVVVTAVDAAGIWRALSLPQLLPDFLIYDEGLGPAAAEVVLGRDARVLAGGFFDLDWKLPRQIGDPVGAPR
ncbi:MAG: hypothetical protein DYH12_03160, partial [Sorangiineae bacterium PRO1]|nr:hypothetical protein [Sorangiineae bacterium PRO1]